MEAPSFVESAEAQGSPGVSLKLQGMWEFQGRPGVLRSREWSMALKEFQGFLRVQGHCGSSKGIVGVPRYCGTLKVLWEFHGLAEISRY